MQAVTCGLFLILWICFSAAAKAQKSCSGRSIPKNQNIELPSDLSDIYPHGHILRLQCQIGYMGYLRISCNNEVWTISGRARCEPRPCGHPGDTPYGDFILSKGEDFVFGSQVEYTCKKGYILAGKVNHRSCMDKGWDNTVPICEVVKCTPIKTTQDMLATGNTENPQYGDVIQFECQDDDKKIYGEKQIYCTDSGEWSARTPECKDVTCEVPVIPNGRVTSQNTIYKKGDNLLFACGEYYKPVGRASSVCTEHDWRPRPQCEERTCKVDKLANISPQKAVFYPGESATIVCNPPYTTHTRKHRDTVECGYNGWSFDIDCKEIFCHIRPEDNTTPYYRGYSIAYKKSPPYYACRSGFKKYGQSTCEVGGWVPPLCQEITCDSEIPNAIILSGNKKYKPRERLEYKCMPFHEPERSQYAYCTENGWDRKTECKPMKSFCKRPHIDNGYYIDDENPSVIHYGCLPHYKPVVEGWWGELTCKQNEWSDNPKCIDETKCVPPTILNAKLEESKDFYSHSDFLKIQCDNGYEMESNARTQCINGTWKSPLPICKPSATMCNPPSRVEHAIITSKYKTKYSHRSKVQFKCEKLHEMEGNGEVSCNNGTWGPIPKCIRSQCSSPDDKVNNAVLVHKKEGPYENGIKVAYKCEDTSFIPEGETTAICINGNWKYPHCIRRDDCEKPDLQDGFVPVQTYNEGHILDYQCYNPCKPKTNSSIICKNGQWNHLVECVCPQSTTKTCQEPPVPVNGDILRREVKDGETVVTYQCRLYYKLKHDAEVKCHMGEWKPFPICIEPCVIEKIDPKYNLKDPKEKTYVSHGEKKTLKCKEYHYVNNRWEDEIDVKCQDGKMDYKTSCRPYETFYGR